MFSMDPDTELEHARPINDVITVGQVRSIASRRHRATQTWKVLRAIYAMYQRQPLHHHEHTHNIEFPQYDDIHTRTHHARMHKTPVIPTRTIVGFTLPTRDV